MNIGQYWSAGRPGTFTREGTCPVSCTCHAADWEPPGRKQCDWRTPAGQRCTSRAAKAFAMGCENLHVTVYSYCHSHYAQWEQWWQSNGRGRNWRLICGCGAIITETMTEDYP